jgi:hypothetical protein
LIGNSIHYLVACDGDDDGGDGGGVGDDGEDDDESAKYVSL